MLFSLLLNNIRSVFVSWASGPRCPPANKNHKEKVFWLLAERSRLPFGFAIKGFGEAPDETEGKKLRRAYGPGKGYRWGAETLWVFVFFILTPLPRACGPG